MEQQTQEQPSRVLYRVEVMHWSHFDQRFYWADTGCGELSGEKAIEVHAASRRAHYPCRIVTVKGSR